jgi:hypothetical protein
MSNSVPTREDVITSPSTPVKVMLRAFSFEKNAPSTGCSTPCALILLRQLVGEILGEAVVLTSPRAADRLADRGHGVRELPLHLDRDLVCADVGPAEVVNIVAPVNR